MTKTAGLTLRMDSEVKLALSLAAKQERRSMSNMLEVLVRDYWHRRGVTDLSRCQSNLWSNQ
jgi:hypothetical protein